MNVPLVVDGRAACPVTIHTVNSRADLRDFIELPWSIYRGNPHWVPPLRSEMAKLLDRRRNAYFAESSAEYFLARGPDGTVQGRIAATRFARHLEIYGDATGFCGFFECVDAPAVASALFEAAGAWLRAQGLRRMRGPASFTINDEVGVLIAGHDRPPAVMMQYNPPYYQGLFEFWGFRKAHDLFAYEITAGEQRTDVLGRIARLMAKRNDFTVRSVVLSRFAEETMIFERIFADAWHENWGAVPLREGEFRQAAEGLKSFMVPELILIGERQGRPVGILFALPDLNQALRQANGRLFPFGLLKMLWARRRIRHARVVLLGIEKDCRRLGLEAVLLHHLEQTLVRLGYESAEFSWILESNAEMNTLLPRLGARRTKTYRIYDRDLEVAQ
jgi:GNAT superfamily N-acetyltransferase